MEPTVKEHVTMLDRVLPVQQGTQLPRKQAQQETSVVGFNHFNKLFHQFMLLKSATTKYYFYFS